MPVPGIADDYSWISEGEIPAFRRRATTEAGADWTAGSRLALHDGLVHGCRCCPGGLRSDRRRCPFLIAPSDHAAQIQCRPPPPDPESPLQGDELAAYEAGLRQRGSLTIWFSEEAVAAWRAAPRTTPGGQARYSDLAIETSLILQDSVSPAAAPDRRVVGSLLELMGLDLPVPDHSAP